MGDEELLALLIARSEEAVSALNETYGAYCRTIAGNILTSAEDVEECLSDACLALWNAIPPARPQCLKAYLGTVVRNAALRRRRTVPEPALELDEALIGRDTVTEHWEAKALGEAISAFLQRESADARGAFLRRYWYADSVEAVALRFGWSVSKTKSVLFRTRKRLRAYLEKEGFFS
ncbi:MAG: sigma-70 family RNA polymerase sigma factor [Oscillospiraceae bacterium]|nr:sigma-70 family RNA polymerase sigma factor [Oscillospiraceae bacterium]